MLRPSKVERAHLLQNRARSLDHKIIFHAHKVPISELNTQGYSPATQSPLAVGLNLGASTAHRSSATFSYHPCAAQRLRHVNFVAAQNGA